MLEPIDAVGKIVKSMEKYFNTKTGKIDVKSRPSLIIGFELDYNDKRDVDYELMPIATLKYITPDKTYDYKIEGDLRLSLGLDQDCFVRSHKITWNNVKHMKLHRPIGDLKALDPKLFRHLLLLNEKWVTSRNIHVLDIADDDTISKSG